MNIIINLNMRFTSEKVNFEIFLMNLWLKIVILQHRELHRGNPNSNNIIIIYNITLEQFTRFPMDI